MTKSVQGEGMLLMRSVEDIEQVHEHQRAGRLRASIPVLDGTYAAIGMISAPQPRQHAMSTSLCPPGSICDYYDLFAIVNKVSGGGGMPEAAYYLLSVENGARQAVAGSLVNLARGFVGEQAYVAAAHLFGRGAHNLVVEVMADDRDVFHRLSLQVTDLAGVRSVHPQLLHTELALGMGT